MSKRPIIHIANLESSLKLHLTPNKQKKYTNKPLQKKFIKELEARRWKKESKDTYESLEVEYKRLHGTTGKLSQGDDLPGYLREHNDQNVRMVDEIFKTIKEMNRTQTEKLAKEKAKEKGQEKSKQQELEREVKRQSEENERILKAQIAQLKSKIQSINFPTIKTDVYIFLSNVNNYLALPQLKDDQGLIALKKEFEALSIGVDNASKEVKFSDNDTAEQLQTLLTTTVTKHNDFLTQFNTAKAKISTIITNEKMLEIFECTEKETYLALDETQKNLSTLEISTLRESINWSEDKPQAKQVRPTLDLIGKEINEIKNNLIARREEIPSISPESKNISTKIQLERIVKLRNVKSSIEAQGKIVTEKTKELESIIASQPVTTPAKEEKAVETPTAQIKLEFGADLVEQYLKPIHDSTQKRIKKYTCGFWTTQKDINKFSAAAAFNQEITKLAVAILNSNFLAAKIIYDSIIYKENYKPFSNFYTAASKGSLCGFSITTNDKKYFQEVTSNIESLKTAIEQRVNNVKPEQLTLTLKT